MSDLKELLSAFDAGRLLRPSYEALNIVDLSRAVAGLCGATETEPTAGSAEIARLIGPSEHLVFVLVDGLGMVHVNTLSPDSVLRRHLVAELMTVFPSSSATAITSLATGQWPGTHGVTGRWTHFPEIRTVGEVLPYIARGNGRSLIDDGMAPDRAFPAPSLISEMSRDTLCLFPESLADSVYSSYFAGHRGKRGYRLLSEAVDEVIGRVGSAGFPTYSHLYTHRIDSTAHKFGSDGGYLRAALRELERGLERLFDGLAGRCRVVVSADHGFLDTPVAYRSQIRPTDELISGLTAPPSGDARVLYFHVRDGFMSQVQHYLHRELGRHFWVITAEEAEELELLGRGPVSPLTRQRMGDLMAISKGPGVVEYRPDGKPGRVTMNVSNHSGLTPSEIMVPLVVA